MTLNRLVEKLGTNKKGGSSATREPIGPELTVLRKLRQILDTR